MENRDYVKPAFVVFIENNIEMLLRTEKIAFYAFLLGFSGHLLLLPASHILLMGGALAMAVVHFALAFYNKDLVDMEPTWNAGNELGSYAFTNFIHKLSFISLSLIDFSMIYLIIGAPITFVVPVVGGMTLIPTVLFTFLAKLNNREFIYNKLYYIRAGLGVLFFLYLTLRLVVFV